jgi:hypothetical protein
MVYLVIKELSGIAQDVIMATSSLTKDMNDKMAAEIGYRANAIRALCTITDVHERRPLMIFIDVQFIIILVLDGTSNRAFHQAGDRRQGWKCGMRSTSLCNSFVLARKQGCGQALGE